MKTKPILRNPLVIVGLLAIVSVVVGGAYVYQKNNQFSAIDKMPPASEYNMSNPIVKAAFDRLPAYYSALEECKGKEDKCNVIDPGIMRANAFVDMGDTGRAILAYKWLIEKRPAGLQAYSNLANLYVKIGRYDLAEKNYLTAITNTKGLHIEPYEGLYNLYSGYMKDKLFQIEAILQTAIKQNPEQANFYMLLGQYYESQGRTGDAVINYKKVLEINPTNQALKDKIKELTK